MHQPVPILIVFATFFGVLACSGPAPIVVSPTTPHSAADAPSVAPSGPSQLVSINEAAPVEPSKAQTSASSGPSASPSPFVPMPSIAMPTLAQGKCAWGQPSGAPPPSRLAQLVCNGLGTFTPKFVNGLPLEQRIFLARSGVQSGESTLLWAGQHNVPPGNVLRSLAESYAELECVEADLCASATMPGSQEDIAAANAARQRMDDLCAQLRQIQTYVGQCP
jgi:hypothetical protein